MNGIRIFGLGSPHGDDRVGWEVVRQLQEQAGDDVEVRTLTRPVDLLDHLEGITLLILVDACRSGATPGTIHRLEGEDRLEQATAASTHGLDVGMTLALARSLGRPLPRVILFGVEAENRGPGDDISQPVRQALPEVCRLVLREVASERGEQP